MYLTSIMMSNTVIIARLLRLTVTACAVYCRGVKWSQLLKGTSPSSFLSFLRNILRDAFRSGGNGHTFATLKVPLKRSG